jgi:hypothetical protein
MERPRERKARVTNIFLIFSRQTLAFFRKVTGHKNASGLLRIFFRIYLILKPIDDRKRAPLFLF